MLENSFVCAACGQEAPAATRDWRCACGGLFELSAWPAFDPGRIDPAAVGLWRYRALLPLEAPWAPVTLGEGSTPLVGAEWDGQALHYKLEFASPTGSFKDRGAALLVTALRGLGIERVVEDSSGNAAASLAAYAARAGIFCELCVPGSTTPPKLAQMVAYGASVIPIKGKREYAALAAWAAAAHGAYYASHVYNPYFLAGIETVAWELWEQLGRQAPAAVVVPVGNGTLFLGLYRGFSRLLAAALIDRLPSLFGVQAAACAPIHRAFAAGEPNARPVVSQATAAAGIAVGHAARAGQILAAARASGGAILSVQEDELLEAHTRLARQGFYVEETSAVATAALPQIAGRLRSVAPVVVVLTGNGLKSTAPAVP